MADQNADSVLCCNCHEPFTPRRKLQVLCPACNAADLDEGED